jgi:hypothetical protein
MRLVLRCFAASTALTFLIAALIFVSRSNLLSNMAGALILPAAWLSECSGNSFQLALTG